MAGTGAVVAMSYEKDWEEIALVVHGGTIMSILGAYGFPKQDYFEWHVNNGEGYRVRFSPEAFCRGSRRAGGGRQDRAERRIEARYVWRMPCAYLYERV